MGTARGGRLHKFDQEYRCGTLQPGGGSEPNEGKRTLAYYPKIDDKYCFLDAMAYLNPCWKENSAMFSNKFK